ncbi:hypothetical protein NP511_09580 [Natrinema thermotolerans]|uniref:Uncharacterized protein n=1 Tax=Natrinema thermotolerans TaxID=121872 RepID=A0AAF0PET3_9EURY|nr:hypothetical protein [Natrinema thermotolerans]QCC58711.1 hypothetical protein DVR14_08760 [Natrinema thermotolerans]WMT09861.1 hypothetical protein NP511_09580 [Natrinema thermotolerans]
MVWQDLLFMAGSLLSVVVLAPALRDVNARIPLATSLPKMALGGVYAITFATMGMSLAAVGLLATGLMWGLLAAYRSPSATAPARSRPNAPVGAVANDGQRPLRRLED